MRFWNRWFRVDTVDVVERLIKSLLFFNKSLVEAIKTVPDLYGPFWIYTTLGFMLGISANLDKYVAEKNAVLTLNLESKIVRI